MNVQERVSRETLLGSQSNLKVLHFDADTTSYQLVPGENVVRATSENADGSAIIKLPSKAECVGQFYYIAAPTGATGGDISVYDKESGAEIATYGDLDADDDHVMFFCDGVVWRMVLDGVA